MRQALILHSEANLTYFASFLLLCEGRRRCVSHAVDPGRSWHNILASGEAVGIVGDEVNCTRWTVIGINGAIEDDILSLTLACNELALSPAHRSAAAGREARVG